MRYAETTQASRPLWLAAAGLLVVVGLSSVAAAQDQAPARPVGADVAAGDRTIKLLEVVGSVDKLNAAAAEPKWLAAKTGDVLGETWTIRTGLGARVVLQLGDRARVTIRAGTKLGIKEFRGIEQKKVQTRLGLKYGSIHVEVDSTRGANDFKIADPVAVSSVTGTGWTQAANVDTGYAHQNTHGSSNSTYNGTGGTQNTANGEQTDGNGTRHGDLAKKQLALGNTGDPNGGMTPGELRSNNLNGGGRGFGNDAGGANFPGGNGGLTGGNGPGALHGAGTPDNGGHKEITNGY